MTAMSISLTLLAFSLVSGVVAAWEKHFAPKRKRRALGVLALILLVISLVVQGCLAVYKGMEEESLNTFLENQETTIEEASGAAYLKDNVFVVDDESPTVYGYRYNQALGRASLEKQYRILPGPTMQPLFSSEEVKPGSERVSIDIAKVDDLEAAAAYNGKLYVISSHSRDKKGDRKSIRELILEIDRFVTLPKLLKEKRVRCPEDKREGEGNHHPSDSIACVRRAATLTTAVNHALKEISTWPRSKLRYGEEGANIEGLAIDDRGVVYIGLRNPLVDVDGQLFAILLQTTVESVFTDRREVRIIRLRLEKGNAHYGIASLEYDQEGGTLLILGNGPEKRNDVTPRLWLWHPNLNEADEPPRAAWSLRMPKEFDAKPEALALSGDGGPAFVFIDAPGHGGQRVVPRKKLGLPEIADPTCTGKLAEKRP